MIHLPAETGPLVGRRLVRRAGADVVVAPLAGGPAGLLRGRDQIVSLLGEPPGRVTFLRRLLERRQAAASTLLVATSRPVAVACAQRWSLDLARIRVQPEGSDLDRWLEVELSRPRAERPAWHRR
ncbi:MAG: hypothetical protein M3024_10840 [Candidatus Dormibacteraeota bacterium]|nr:hypothetical protein [Candidatus Dormibacteraeota bacterium]